MRDISSAALATLAQRHGTEPITIIEVEWAPGRVSRYADRTIAGIPGAIIAVSGLDHVVALTHSNYSQSVDVTLDDTDAALKTIFDTQDVHQCRARVYQYFHGLDLADKFLLLSGQVNTPVEWDERDRTLRFTILSQLEDREIGFSAEEGQFPFIPARLVGRPWPMLFGTVQDSPCLRITEAIQGTTLTGVGVFAGEEEHLNYATYETGTRFDTSLATMLARIDAQLRVLACGEYCWRGVDAERAAQIATQGLALEQQRINALREAQKQEQCALWHRRKQLEDVKAKGLGANPITVLGGEDFPQKKTLTIDINGGIFEGYFAGTAFHVSRRWHPEASEDAAEDWLERQDLCPYEIRDRVQHYEYALESPKSCFPREFHFQRPRECRIEGWIVATGDLPGSRNSTDPLLRHLWAEPGATVRLHGSQPTTYIVSITPGEVLAVRAYKQFIGERRLVDVPPELYTVETKTYGSITAVQLVFDRPLSTIADQGWSDDVYVTFASTIGPNIVDILSHLIDTYTDLEKDTASFAYVREKLERYPANFPILDRRNIITVLQEIAYQARCALWLNNGVFHLRYLPEEPEPVDTITESDIDAESGAVVSFTPTEDLATKMKITWRMSWAPGQTDRDQDRGERLIILRHNVAKYGVHETSDHFYIYNQPDSILKCATFWLIRQSNTWKRVRFRTFLTKLNLEPFDCVTLDFGHVAHDPVKAIIETVIYDSQAHQIEIECLVPVRAGEMAPSPYFWPANLPTDSVWPSRADIERGYAGGGGIGMDATGMLPVGLDAEGNMLEPAPLEIAPSPSQPPPDHRLQVVEIRYGGDLTRRSFPWPSYAPQVWVGGPNVIFTGRSDWGDLRPTDVGFQPQPVVLPEVFAELDASLRPRLNLKPYLLRPSDPIVLPDLNDGGGISLDIATTKVVDSESDDPERIATLKSLLGGITEEGRLTLRDDAMVASAEHTAPFHFEYDTEGKVFGAGTAFLQD